MVIATSDPRMTWTRSWCRFNRGASLKNGVMREMSAQTAMLSARLPRLDAADVVIRTDGLRAHAGGRVQHLPTVHGGGVVVVQFAQQTGHLHPIEHVKIVVLLLAIGADPQRLVQRHHIRDRGDAGGQFHVPDRVMGDG